MKNVVLAKEEDVEKMSEVTFGFNTDETYSRTNRREEMDNQKNP